jgi:hypothetical protein
VVARNLGLTDALEVTLHKLKPDTVYSVYASGQATPVASLRTNAKGMANGTAIGPMREVVGRLGDRQLGASRILIMEGEAPADPQKAVLSGAQ